MHRAGRICSSSKCLRRDAFRSFTQHNFSGPDGVKVDHAPLNLVIPAEHSRAAKRARKAIKKSQESLDKSNKNSDTVIKTLVKAGKRKKEKQLEDGKSSKIFIDSRDAAQPELPLRYSRKIEGLLEDTGSQPVLETVHPPSEQKSIATLAHGLDRVLFNPGVHWQRDPRSRVYNFPPSLEEIPRVTDFDFDRLPGFVKSSRDEDLRSLARSEHRRFAGSTSSLSGILSQVYFLISGNKQVDISTLSLEYKREPTSFTPGQRMPVSVVFNYNDGIYAVDSDPNKADAQEKNILLWMGTLLEKYLTTPLQEFSSYLRSNTPPPPDKDTRREAYRYAKSQKFVMRSQLDCHDTRLPGTGVFDIKTRACLPIRMDLLNFEENSGYLIRSQHGLMESFEREYYDLIRSAFLKYSFQARIGNMDGVLVAYHNTARLFGYQYVPLQEMDERIFGSLPGTGDKVFVKCVSLMEIIADEIALCFPNQSVNATFEEDGDRHLNIWVEPLEWEGDHQPIKQLVVTSTSYLQNLRVHNHKAFGEIDEPWTIHWTITRSAGQETVIRQRLLEARERQFRAYSLPSGVPLDQIEAFWKALNFNGKSQEELDKLVTPLKKNFQTPDHMIRALRNLARAGRADTEKLAIDEAGKPKIVWNHMLADEQLPLDAAALISEEETVMNIGVEPLVEDDDNLVAVAATDRDITDDAVRAEAALQEEPVSPLVSEPLSVSDSISQETSEEAAEKLQK